MNKKILISLSVIAVVAAVVVGGTIAYFSDTETSVGNTFTAGTIDISLDSSDGQAVTTVSGDLDLKPSQTGWTTAMVTNDGTNPAEIWKHIGNVVNEENDIVEPEQEYYIEHPGSENWKLSNWIHYDMLVYKSLGYSYSESIDIEGSDYNLELTVEDGDGWQTWTFDFPVEEFTGDGNLNVGLVIALDGEGNGPAYQIHNTDSNDMTFINGTPVPAGTWAMSPWGPTTNDGWFGWHGDTNTLVTELDWVEASGDRKGQGTDGILQIKIKKCALGGTIHWAASPTVGSGFWDAYDVTMQIPTGFGWATPLVTMNIPNYIEAAIATLIKEIPESAGFFLTGQAFGVESNWMYLGVLEPEESMCVKQSYHLDSTVDNWGQSDMVTFDVDFMAQQTTPLPDPPANILPGYGR